MFRSFICILFVITASCSKDQFTDVVVRPNSCDSTRFSFEEHIRPIFNANCNSTQCHATSGNGSYDLTLYSVAADRIRAGTMEYRLDLPVDDPQHMPESRLLSPCDYFTIKAWIKQGYPEN